MTEEVSKDYVILQDKTEIEVLFVTPCGATATGENLIEIGAIGSDTVTLAFIEEKFSDVNLKKIEVGSKCGDSEMTVYSSYSGFSKIKSLSKECNYGVGQLDEITLIRIVLQEPDLREEVKKANNDVMLALTEVYEMILAQEV